MTAPPFIVFSTSRSRSTWLSAFLTEWATLCGHDQLCHSRSFDDIKSWFSQPDIGTVETAAASWWRSLERYAPNARVATLRRPADEIIDSLQRQGVEFDITYMTRAIWRQYRKLDQIAKRLPNVQECTFDGLTSQETCESVFQHLLGRPCQEGWWAYWHDKILSPKMEPYIRQTRAYFPQMIKMSQMITQQTITDMHLKAPKNIEGVVIEEEDVRKWWTETIPLMKEHLVAIGESPMNWENKNEPAFERMYAKGNLQVVTARSNGKIYGYLLTAIGADLTKRDGLTAYNMAFYASPLIPGLGLKLQRHAIARLKTKNVGEVWVRSGVLASGPKLDILYKRLGAEPGGHLQRIDLSE